MSQSNNDECYTYVACIDEDGNVSAWVELGCISDDAVNDNVQTSNLPICRKNKTIRKKIDGVESGASFTLQVTDETDRAVLRWFKCAAKKCKELAIAYLDKEITEPDNFGDVIYGPVSTNWTRNVGEKNLAVTQETTLGSWCWEDYQSLPCANPPSNTGDATTLPNVLGGDVPAIPGCDAAGLQESREIQTLNRQISDLRKQASIDSQIERLQKQRAGLVTADATPAA